LLIALTVLVIVATVMLARGEAAVIAEDEEHDAEATEQPKEIPSEPVSD
jgi:hypothetical protein